MDGWMDGWMDLRQAGDLSCHCHAPYYRKAYAKFSD